MAWSGSCSGEQVCGQDRHCAGCRDLLAHPETHALATREIPVRRYGTVPELPDESPEWEIQWAAPAGGPRTIAEYGGAVVFAAAVATALMAGVLIYRLN